MSHISPFRSRGVPLNDVERPPRADEARGLDHVLNRVNFGTKMFRQEGDLVAFEKILHEAFRLDKILIGLVESTCLLPFLLIRN